MFGRTSCCFSPHPPPRGVGLRSLAGGPGDAAGAAGGSGPSEAKGEVVAGSSWLINLSSGYEGAKIAQELRVSECSRKSVYD